MTRFKILTKSKERLKELNRKLKENKVKFNTRGLPYKEYNFGMIPKEKEREMKEAASRLDFELAAILRDEVKALTSRRKR